MRPKAPSGETSVGDKCGRQVGDNCKSMRPRAPEWETSAGGQVGDTCKIMRPRARSGKQMGDKCKIMRPRAPRVGDKWETSVKSRGSGRPEWNASPEPKAKSCDPRMQPFETSKNPIQVNLFGEHSREGRLPLPHVASGGKHAAMAFESHWDAPLPRGCGWPQLSLLLSLLEGVTSCVHLRATDGSARLPQVKGLILFCAMGRTVAWMSVEAGGFTGSSEDGAQPSHVGRCSHCSPPWVKPPGFWSYGRYGCRGG